jgi:DNA-binding NarL/FixJ family response regulator
MDQLKVFISDDSATIREHLISTLLALPGITVVGQARDVAASLDGIRQTQPHVVVLDIRMPGGNGISVLRKVKKMDPAPKVIMFTNFAYPQYREKCEQAGADYFLDKSTEFDRLPQALEQVHQSLRTESGAGGSPAVPAEPELEATQTVRCFR